ncbi:hypothetical protein J6590_068599 [Homalodisca vitripennis]|nr:hypothetical protein J6590_068599 [Homalodisca vitripennis]
MRVSERGGSGKWELPEWRGSWAEVVSRGPEERSGGPRLLLLDLACGGEKPLFHHWKGVSNSARECVTRDKPILSFQPLKRQKMLHTKPKGNLSRLLKA